jgi:hypothetical protein
LSRPGKDAVAPASAEEQHTTTFTLDVINNWSGITEAGKAVEHGRHTIRMQMVVIVLVTVKFSVGTVIKGRKASAAKKFYYSRY